MADEGATCVGETEPWEQGPMKKRGAFVANAVGAADLQERG